MKKLIYLSVILISNVYNAQTGNVGIGTQNPTENLDVNGTTYTNKLYLRNPGFPTEPGGRYLVTSNNKLDVQDPSTETSAFYNYIKLTLTGIPKQGLTDYDTKIDANKFVLVLHSYYITSANDDEKILLDYNRDGSNNSKQGSPNFTAFRSNGTWHITGNFINSNLVYNAPGGVNLNYNTFKIAFNLVAYKYLITKNSFPSQTVNLGGTDGSATPLTPPPGF